MSSASGSDYHFMHNGPSQLSSQKSLDDACKQVDVFDADMGGTEIYTCLQDIYQRPLRKGYPRFIFLLTDGGVSNTSKVLDLIKSHNDKAQVFTVGLGNGCSAELITKGALYGRGKHEFVANNNEIYEKVIGLLNSSISPCFSEFSFHADNFDAVIKSVSPNPASVPFLLSGQTATFFLFLRQDAFSNDASSMILKLRMYDTRAQAYRTVDLKLNESDALENEMISKLGLFNAIRSIESEEENVSNNEQSVLWMDKAEIKKTLVELSVKYGILCKETAFICEVTKDDEKHVVSTEKIKVTVPAIRSRDYELDRCVNTTYPCSALHLSSHTPAGPERLSKLMSSLSIAPAYTALNSSLHTPEEPERFSNLLSYLNTAPAYTALSSSPNASARSQFFSSLLSGNTKPESAALRSSSNTALSKAERLMRLLALDTDAKKCSAEPLSMLKDQSTALSSQHKDSSKESKFSTLLSTQTYDDPPSLPKPSANISSYLDVATKQRFEGCWDHTDQALYNLILKDGTLSKPPSELKTSTGTDAPIETIWMTMLVLFWLETVFQSEKKAWSLIHQKGCEWLKEQDIDYEQCKDLGKPYIKV